MLELKAKMMIKEKGEIITKITVNLQQVLAIINLKHKTNAYFPVTINIWTIVRNT